MSHNKLIRLYDYLPTFWIGSLQVIRRKGSEIIENFSDFKTTCIYFFLTVLKESVSLI